MIALQEAGLRPVVFDDFSTGRVDFVPKGTPVVGGDVREIDSVRRALDHYQCSGVIHLAGAKSAGDSVRRPLYAYSSNVGGALSLLQAMEDEGVTNLVFSSSASVYGTPQHETVSELDHCAPSSPYGETKLVSEWLIRDQSEASDFLLNAVSLRYFNVIGTEGEGGHDVSRDNVLPRVFRALRAGEELVIYGDTYDTPDGTCIRDYIHVGDVARVHVAAALSLTAGSPLDAFYNLGTGSGTSVHELIDAVFRVTGLTANVRIAPPRRGDPGRIVADGSKATQDLNWRHTYTLDEMVRSAWVAFNRGVN